MLATSVRRSASVLAATLAVAVASVASAQPAPPLDFVRVGAPGNRGTLPEEAPRLAGWRPVGAVAYEFQITRTEVTVAQWFEFVKAYAPHHTGSMGDSAFTSFFINWDGANHSISPGGAGLAADPSWRFAARYVNWLHNDKRPEREAFERGVYDTATFGGSPSQGFTDQQRRSPGSKYWIPDLDEMIKATRYDPDRYGPGQGGYWMYGHKSQTAPISGLPGQGGQTSAGLPFSTSGLYPDLGSYPEVASPWGLLEVSGGLSEMTETVSDPSFESRLVIGSRRYSTVWFIEDRIDEITGAFPSQPGEGFRVATIVPCPGVLGIALASFALPRRGRRSS